MSKNDSGSKGCGVLIVLLAGTCLFMSAAEKVAKTWNADEAVLGAVVATGVAFAVGMFLVLAGGLPATIARPPAATDRVAAVPTAAVPQTMNGESSNDETSNAETRLSSHATEDNHGDTEARRRGSGRLRLLDSPPILRASVSPW